MELEGHLEGSSESAQMCDHGHPEPDAVEFVNMVVIPFPRVAAGETGAARKVAISQQKHGPQRTHNTSSHTSRPIQV